MFLAGVAFAEEQTGGIRHIELGLNATSNKEASNGSVNNCPSLTSAQKKTVCDNIDLLTCSGSLDDCTQKIISKDSRQQWIRERSTA